MTRVVCEVRALAVLPTKELAQQVQFITSLHFFFLCSSLACLLHFVHYGYGSPSQVYKVFCTYAEGTGLKVVMAAGQKPFAVEQATLLEIR